MPGNSLWMNARLWHPVAERETPGTAIMKSLGGLPVTVKPVAASLFVIFLSSCSAPNPQEQQISPEKAVAEKPFAPGGNIEMKLDGGNYILRGAADNVIRVAFGGNTGNARAELTVDGPRANVAVKDTSHNNFHASIDVPRSSNVVIHLSAGNLEMSGIVGDKDINSGAGNVEITILDPDEYSTAEGSVKAGDIDASVFGKSGSGLNPHFDWQGHGKYKLRASLGAGNLVLKRK
jgi:hypothetical protein